MKSILDLRGECKMRENFKRGLMSGIALIATLTGLVGCSLEQDAKPEGNNSPPVSLEVSTVTEAKEVKKPDSLKFAINVGLKVEDGFDKWREEYINKTGINLEFEFIESNDYYQKIEFLFASGNTADVFAVGNDKLAVYAGQGALLDITEMVENSAVLSKIDDELIDSVRVNGKLYGVPIESGGGTVTYVRQDWLDQLGIQAPTTYNEFIHMLRQFKTLGDDIIPFTAPGLVADQAEFYLREFYQDASPEFIKNSKGKWVDGMTEPNMVAALQRMRDAYAEGLIDLEVVTNKTSTCRDKWYAGKVGAFTYWAGNWYTSLETRVQENVPEAKATPIAPIKETYYIKRVPAVLSVSSLSQNPEAAFKYLIEYANDGGEGSTLFQHGVEGLHFKYEASGKVIAEPKLTKPEEILEKAFVSPVLAAVKIQTPGYSFDVDERIPKSNAILDAYSKQAEIVPVSDELSKINEELLKEKEKTVVAIVMGQISIKDGLAQYKVSAENLGIAQVIEELNAAQ